MSAAVEFGEMNPDATLEFPCTFILTPFYSISRVFMYHFVLDVTLVIDWLKSIFG